MEFKDGKVVNLWVNGEKIPENEIENYRPIINDTKLEIIEGKKEIKIALKEIEEGKLEEELAVAQKELKELDLEALHEELKRAQEEFESIDNEALKMEMEKAREEMEKIDHEQLNMIMLKASEAMDSINWEIIKSNAKNFEDLDFNDTLLFVKNFDEDLDSIWSVNFDKYIKDIDWDSMDEQIKEAIESSTRNLKNMDKLKHIDIDIDMVELKDELNEKLKELEEIEIEKGE